MSARTSESQIVTHEDDVNRIFARAACRASPVSFQGAGHSCGGQSLATDGGIQLINRLRQTEARALPPDEIEVASGLSWRTVELELMQRGRACPVVTDKLDLSVGGTLSVGGYGMDSILRGAQLDHVTGYSLLTPGAGQYWCSPEHNPQLFRYGLCCLGQLGMITAVRMRVTPFRDTTELWRYSYASLTQAVDSMRWLDEAAQVPPLFRATLHVPHRGGPTHVQYGAAVSDESSAQLQLVRSALGTPDAKERLTCYRLANSRVVDAWLARFGHCRRLWVDYGLTYDQFVPFCEELDKMLLAGIFGETLAAVNLLVVAPSPHGAGCFPFDIRSGGTRRTFTCGLYCMIPAGDETALATARHALEICYRMALARGGRPYIYGWYELDGRPATPAGFERFHLEELARLRSQLDPASVIHAPWHIGHPQRLP